MTRKYGLAAGEMGQLRDVLVPGRLRNQLLAAAQPAIVEFCAALYGSIQDSTLAITGWRPLTNLAASGHHFLVAVHDLIGPPTPSTPATCSARAIPTAQLPGPPRVRLVGLLHSHPQAPAYPSDADRIGIAHLPFVWIIMGTAPGGLTDLRSFAWSAAGVGELPTRVVPAQDPAY